MRFIILFISILFSPISLAMFCPSNFSSIDIGNTLEQVIQTCGEPTSKATNQKSNIASAEWVYYVKTADNSQGTSKMTIVFQDNKVVNITQTDNGSLSPECATANQMGINVLNVACQSTQVTRNVASSSFCNSLIKIGDTSEMIQSACGKPVFVQNQQQDTQNATEVTELNYAGPPAVTLIFENGILKDRRQ